MELRSALKALRKKLIIILLFTIVCTLISFVISVKSYKKTYEANCTLYSFISQSGTTISSDNIESSRKLLTDYQRILKSDRVLRRIKAIVGYKHMSIGEFSNKVELRSQQSSGVFYIYGRDRSKYKAAKIANASNYVLTNECKSLMGHTYIKTVSRAYVPKYPLALAYLKFILNVFLISLVTIIVLILLIDYVKHDNTAINSPNNKK